MSGNDDIGNAPWSLRVAFLTKPRAHSDTSVFNSKCIPTSNSSPELTRKLSDDNVARLPLVQVETSSSTNLNAEENDASSCVTLSVPKKERSQTMRPKSSNSEKALDFLIKITKSDRNLSERMSPRNIRKQKRKSRNEETVNEIVMHYYTYNNNHNYFVMTPSSFKFPEDLKIRCSIVNIFYSNQNKNHFRFKFRVETLNPAFFPLPPYFPNLFQNNLSE